MPRYYAQCNRAYTLFQNKVHLDGSTAMADHPGQEVVEIPDVDPMAAPRLRRVLAYSHQQNAKPSKLCISFITGKIHERNSFNMQCESNRDLHPLDDTIGPPQA